MKITLEILIVALALYSVGSLMVWHTLPRTLAIFREWRAVFREGKQYQAPTHLHDYRNPR